MIRGKVAEATNLEHAEDTYRATFETQNKYRGGGFSLEQCHEDTIEAAKAVCLTPSDQAAAHTEHQKILRSGQRGLGSHLLTEPFTFDRHARVAAARAALVATMIKLGLTNEIPRDIARSVPSGADLGRIRLSPRHADLFAVLRPTAPEALYYWSMIEDVEAIGRDGQLSQEIDRDEAADRRHPDSLRRFFFRSRCGSFRPSPVVCERTARFLPHVGGWQQPCYLKNESRISVITASGSRLRGPGTRRVPVAMSFLRWASTAAMLSSMR